jgi:hypothetical protein
MHTFHVKHHRNFQDSSAIACFALNDAAKSNRCQWLNGIVYHLLKSSLSIRKCWILISRIESRSDQVRIITFHVWFSQIGTKNWFLSLNRILWASSFCWKWLREDGYTLCLQGCCVSQSLDSELDCGSEKALANSIHYIWIKFTLNTNWIRSIFIFITSITFDSTQCWTSWKKMFFKL